MAMVTKTVMAQTDLTLKDVTGDEFVPEVMSEVKMLPDGESYTVLTADGKRILKYSLKTGKQTDVIFDVNQTQRGKIDGINGYEISPDGTRILVWNNVKNIYRRSFTADHYIYNVQSRVLEPLSDFGAQQSPVWSPDSRNIAFVRNNNIYFTRLNYDNAETQVTKDGKRNEIINGVPDWVNEEEFCFNTALTFTSDGSMICWIRYDEKQVPDFRLNDYVYKYPVAGERNSEVSVRSYDLLSKQVRTMDIPVPEEGYIPRLKVAREADHVVVYTLNRHQDELSVFDVNTRSTVSNLLFKERVDNYVKEEAMEKIIVDSTYILVPSDRSGHMQLHLYQTDGAEVAQLTNIDGEVTDVYGYDEKNGLVYYQAAGKNPLNREVYVTDRKGKTTCLTDREGWNSAVFSKDYSHFILTWSDANTPYQYSICNNKGKEVAKLQDNAALQRKLTTKGVPAKEFFKFKTSEGVELNGVMIRPANFDASKKYPVIMWQYSGPASQQVKNDWSIGSMGNGGMFDNYLTQQGFIVVCVDGRGTGARGAEFEKCVYRKLGQLESKDQVETALYLGSLPYVDKDRIGIWGWSYGGFNTLMSMSEGRPVFKAGVAVAPVTNFRFYDTIYTERYMQTPRENGYGYDENPISRADKLHGELLLIHGTADDNVHPVNTLDYAEALVQADKDFSERFYRGRNHSIYGGNTRNHLLRQIVQHFTKNLK